MILPQADLPIRVAALYRFTIFDDVAAIQGPLATLCCALGVKGLLLLAREGINGTIAGPDAAIAQVLAHIARLPGCADVDVKFSRAASLPFHRMKVRIRREIVTMGQPDLPADTGHYVAPDDWNALIADPETVVIDTRNGYEVAVGTFRGAINPGTTTFQQFPDWFRGARATLLGGGKARRVAMFCTGGIRCEKATAFLKAQGVDDVYHLRGGILTYLETVAAAQSLWEGECFVFDQRGAVGHGLTPGTHRLCHACRAPVCPADQASARYETGVSCPACHGARTDAQRAGYRERHRQQQRAVAQGQVHIGAIFPLAPDNGK